MGVSRESGVVFFLRERAFLLEGMVDEVDHWSFKYVSRLLNLGDVPGMKC